jgi:23S rRNA (pseudouridine1915-N3)-methyltransferase
MSLKIIAIHELKNWAAEAFEEYAKRLSAPFALQHLSVRADKHSPNKEERLAHEAKGILKQIAPGDWVVLCDERGKSPTSIAFSKSLVEKLSSYRNVCFIIGGADGVHDLIRQRANEMLSLSSFVLPHVLARVVLIEQIYRAYSLSTKHPYHRE